MTRANGDHFRATLLSRGGSVDAMRAKIARCEAEVIAYDARPSVSDLRDMAAKGSRAADELYARMSERGLDRETLTRIPGRTSCEIWFEHVRFCARNAMRS